MRKILLLLFIFIACSAFAQKDSLYKQISAVRKTAAIKIDGDISDKEWLNAAKLDSFVEWRPSYGKVEAFKNRTEIYLLYDDQAIYIAGYCHESKDSISKELVGRDVVGVNDFVGVIFDTYNDKINGFGYYVTPLGEQYDAKYSSDGEISSWNSVYQSEAKIINDGWTFEMRIPYSAIRFPVKDIQHWGINLTRKRNKSGIQLMWNPVDPNKGGTFLSMFGVLNNLENIKPPIRLSFSPFFSSYASFSKDNVNNINDNAKTINGGMDVKYGLSQSYTLDMTLLPDFGQVPSDNKVLNLTPFEVRYPDNRPFFNEGVELFSKGGFFYTKRIGDRPYYRSLNVYKNEVLSDVKDNTKLINAFKISGRNENGWGMGFFNAVTGSETGTATDTVTGVKRNIQTDPLTNYNIFVVDKALKHNSSITFINLSTLRAGTDYDANVSSLMWDMYDKKNKWEYFGKYAESQLYGITPGTNIFGHLHTIGFSKVSGNFNFSYWQDAADSKFDPNDLGIFNNNNYLDNSIWVGYKWLKPKWYNNMYYNLNIYYSRRYTPGDYQVLSTASNINGQLKNLWNVGVGIDYAANQNDFYESRIQGMVFKRPMSFGAGFWFGSDGSKKYSASFNFYYHHISTISADGYDISLYQQMRFNNKFTISLNNSYTPRFNYQGWAYNDTFNNSIFGQRNINTVENILNLKYNFNNKMGLTLKARHYWSSVQYNQYYILQNSGYLSSPVLSSNNANDNVNFFNIDLLYTWEFSPGIFIYINWKNAASKEDQIVRDPYKSNLSNTFHNPDLQNNTLSLRIVYYLDYLSLKRKK